MKMNHYYLKARLFPTALTAVPAIVFYNAFVAPLYRANLENVFSTLPTITNATFSAAIVFLLIQLNRACAKELFQRLYFRDELYMPTTNRLLWKDDFFEKSIKQKIRNLIKDKYNIVLPTPGEEAADETSARKLILTAVSQIRISLKDNPMLLQHNIEYGFFRNLVGGSFLAFLFSLMILIFAYIKPYPQFKLIGILLIIIYATPLLLSNFFIKRYGGYYSKILYEQFVSHFSK